MAFCTVRRWWRSLLCFSGIGLLALVLRVADLGLFVTHDEVEFWFARSESLVRALQSGDYAAMSITTHPGVTTMWLGGAGIFLRRLLFDYGLLQHETFSLLVALHRLPVVVVHVVGLLAGYAMLRRLLSPATATLAAVLWATDPFIIGYSRLLHVDALLGMFATLSLLAACLYWNHEPRTRWLLLSGSCAGLAVLSKSPALALGPVVVALALATAMERGPSGEGMSKANQKPPFVRHLFVPLLVWGIAAVVTVVACWPALWVAPLRVYEALRVGVEVEGAQPHMTGNFFLGQSNPSPGVLFYPVVLALRTTPWTLIGLLLLPLSSVKWRASSVERRARCPRDVAVLAGFIILFAVGLSLFPKKFNRYLVPVFPALDILAAVGLVGSFRLLASRGEGQGAGSRGRRSVSSLLLFVVVLAAVVNAVWFHPYQIAYFNQMLGGAPKGARTFAVGWGEGLEQVAAWLNEQPDSTDVLTISHMITSLDPYLRRGARATFPDEGKLKPGAGYVVVYIFQVQGGDVPPPFDQFYGHLPPLHTVTIHGVDYAWVYDAPPLVTPRVSAFFGHTFFLYGMEQQGAARPGEPLRFQSVWQARASTSSDYWLFAHLIGEDGRRYAQVDQPYQTSRWEPGRFVSKETRLNLPPDLPPGTYSLIVGLYDPQQSERLPLTGSPLRNGATAGGPDSLLLMTIMVE